MANADEHVLKALKDAGKPMRPGEVAQATGLDKNEVSKIIQKLKKAGKVMSPKACFWAPID